MNSVLLSPPVTFLTVLAALFILTGLFKKLSFKVKHEASGTGKSYACGEDVPDHLAQPDYSQFFPYAFFFTIAHVAALIITTVPMGSVKAAGMAVIYILAIVVGLYVLLRR